MDAFMKLIFFKDKNWLEKNSSVTKLNVLFYFSGLIRLELGLGGEWLLKKTINLILVPGYSLNQSIRDGTCIWYIPWYFNIQISTSLSQILEFSIALFLILVLWCFPSWRMKMSRSHVKFCCWHISEPTVKLKAGKNSTPGQKIQNHNHLLFCCTVAKKNVLSLCL